MALPLLNYPPSSQNQRVKGFEVPGDEQPRQYALEAPFSDSQVSDAIAAAYRQIFNEQQSISFNRQPALESQLRQGRITVRGFIRGLLLSESFQRMNFDTNSNYRFAELCVQRVLGRAVYNEKEKLAWSIVIATKGVVGFVDELLATDEYLEAFRDDTVPYQRRRILPQRGQGELPFARMARYDRNHLERLYSSGQLRKFDNGVVDRSATVYRRAVVLTSISAIVFLLATLAAAIG
ncbi:MAG: phycobilisome rod-core linker polypeptide [Geitlerinemataceae cyanobacterium]